MWKKIIRKMTAAALAAVCSITLPGLGQMENAPIYAQEQTDIQWTALKEELETYGGTWRRPDYEGAVTEKMPQTALQGNGDVGVVSYGNEKEKTYLISKGDFRNCGDLVTSAPFEENDRSIRQIALGGLTIRQGNPSLTREENVTAKVSSVHDDFAAEYAVNGAISAEEEGWVSHIEKAPHWLEIDLGDVKTIAKYVMYHIGSAREDLTHFNTKAYAVSVKMKSSDDWEEVDSVTDNTENITSHVFEEPIQARYVRIDIRQGQQDSNERARIAEFELFSKASDQSIFAEKEVSADSFTEHQDIAVADLTTDMNIADVPLSINNWVSATENVIVTAIVSKGNESICLNAETWTKADGSRNFPNDAGVLNNGIWSSRSTCNGAQNHPESWTSKAALYTKAIQAEQVAARKNGNASAGLQFSIEPGETVYLITAVGGGGQTYDYIGKLAKEKEPLDEAEALVQKYPDADAVGMLRKEHEQWWKDYWMKSSIHIGDEQLQRYYYGSLYYMGCTARKNTLAPGLYGIWVTTDAARYNNDYHLNYNYMAPFYGMYASNRLEGVYAAVEPILDYMPKAVKAAKEDLSSVNGEGFRNYYNSRGDLAEGIEGAVFYPVGLTAYGHASWEADSGEKYISQTLNGPFAASMFISLYNYSQDETFLAEQAYPFAEKVAAFYEKWCEKEEKPDGGYQYNLYDGAHEGFFDKNAGVTIGMVQNVLEFLIQNYELAREHEVANISEERLALWKDLYTHMAPVPIRTYETGNFKKDIFALSEDGMILRPESASVELEFIHPGERLSFDADPYMLQIARNTVEAKDAANPAVWGNINNAPKIYAQAIRAGYDPSYIIQKFKDYVLVNMKSNFAVIDDEHGIEKAGGIEFINNMLLQSANGILKVFPNWTGVDADFYRLREKGAYLVSARMKDGEVSYVEVNSEAGKEVSIVCPWEWASVTDETGKAVRISYGTTEHTGEKTICFQAEKGKTYRITKSSQNGGDVPETPEMPGNTEDPEIPDQKTDLEITDQKLDKNRIYSSGKLRYQVISEQDCTVTVKGSVKKTEKTIEIPDTVELDGITCTVTEISAKAFWKNKKLKKAVIGKNVTVIGKNAFAKCAKLKKITIKSDKLTKAYASSIKGISKKAVLDVPNKKIKAYKKLFGIKKKSGIKVK